MDIGDWLRQLGLERYAQAFRENDIVPSVLPELTDADLKEIGLTLGHRRLLLKAIQEHQGAEPLPHTGTTEAVAPPSSAERRQLTVLFCDLVGSTELAARLDPEDVGEVIRTYQERCCEVVTRWGGHVAKYMGDGVLAYFGWPRAHEDDAERAVRAGLDLAKEVGQLTTSAGAPLRVRVGIATGLVMVGDLIGEGAAQEQAVVGETPNLAARLQALAAPGAVVIAEGTRRLLGGLFDLDDMGTQDLKGFATSVQAWRVLGASQAESRFEALHGGQLAALVGREHEIGLLVNRWERAKEGEGQVVLLSGEPGIGKSRIVRALRERLAGEPHTPLSHYCSSYHTNSALYPVIGLLERAAGFSRGDPAEVRLDKLEALLGRGTAALGEAVPLVAALLGIETGTRYPAPALSPQRQKQRTLEVLVDQVEGLAATRPVLAIYEDVHWGDPTTLEALDLLIERVQCLPVLVLITFRPEFSPPWTGHAHVMQLSLSRLTRRHGQALVAALTGGKALPEEVLDQILAKTDGVPLFIEELTKAVVESGLLTDAGDRWELTAPLPSIAIPTTLHDSLMARLDRLASAKEVAQIGAVIGREFSRALLAAVADRPEPELQASLDQLVSSELVFRRGAPPQASYSFKHALVQDAAYQSLLKSKRQQLHARIVTVLEDPADTVETQPELLAHHCAQAGWAEKAVDYWHEAGRRAIARSAVAEAVVQLRQGMELLATVPDGLERRRRELDLQVALGGALIAAKGYAAPETGRAFARARALCREEGDIYALLPVMNGQVLFHIERGERHAADEIAAEMLELARRDGRGDAALLIPAHRALSLTTSELGRFAAAREHAEEVLALYDPACHRSLISLYTFDQQVVVLGYLAWTLLVLGYPDQARRRSTEQLAKARELEHPNTLAQALYRACIFNRHARDAAGVREAADALIAAAGAHDLSFFLAIGRLHRGWALIQRGGAEEGLCEIRRGAAEAETAGTKLFPAYLNGLIAEAFILAGRRRDAVRWTAEALAGIGDDTSPWLEGDRNHRCGQLLLGIPEPNEVEAEAYFCRALELARSQDAKMWELRAATSLARLWRDQGRRAEAHDVLVPVYGWFTEGLDTADLKDAKALLDHLA